MLGGEIVSITLQSDDAQRTAVVAEQRLGLKLEIDGKVVTVCESGTFSPNRIAGQIRGIGNGGIHAVTCQRVTESEPVHGGIIGVKPILGIVPLLLVRLPEALHIPIELWNLVGNIET